VKASDIEDIQSMMGKRIRTHEKLETTQGMLVAQRHLNGRRPNALGIIISWVPGHGGDAYWIRHVEGPSSADPSPVAAYCFTEFEFV
jgi:hypothetical protein